MTTADPQRGKQRRFVAIFLICVICMAFVGFLLGINDSILMKVYETPVDRAGPLPRQSGDGHAVPAVTYREMRRSADGPTAQWRQTVAAVPEPRFDPTVVIQPSEEAKLQSIKIRSERRAFNGAPPVVPHPVEKTNDAACYACHGQGMQLGNRVANRMSHGFLANCLQCHAPPAAEPFSDIDARVANAFIGMPTPLAGERAYPGAPPTIPHSTWMRSECLSCHGQQAGWAGLETTHPWRTNCVQCHAPSAELEQGIAAAPHFVSPPVVERP
jgi:cytochrome c-type protein NapB